MNNVRDAGLKKKKKKKEGKTQKRERQNVFQMELNWNDSFLK